MLIYADDNVKPMKDQVVFSQIIGYDKQNRPMGFAAIPMVATKDIPDGEQLLWSYTVKKETDMTPCNITNICDEAKALKGRSKKRSIPVPM